MARTFILLALLLGVAGTGYNQPGQDWVRHVIAEGFPVQTVIAADFTGDGLIDVVTGDITPGHERTILYVAPDWKPVVLYSGIRTIYGVAMDVNGDGRPDIVASRYHPGLIYWLEHPKDPIHDAWTYHVVDDSSRGGIDGVHGLFAGDVDLDGKPDLIASAGHPNRKALFPIRWHGSAFRRTQLRPSDGSDIWLPTAMRPG